MTTARDCMTAWLPYEDLEERVGPLPSGLTYAVYTGSGALPPSGRDVNFYVLPYNSKRESLELISDMPSLQVVQTLTAGVDDVQPYVPAGVTLCNARGVHDASTAELAVTLILASLRGIPTFVHGQAGQRWLHERREALADKVVLILGYGAIGRAIERRLDGFEVEILRVARTARENVASIGEMAQLLPRADVVVATVPLCDQTYGMIDKQFLARMRDGTLLVNVARGRIVDTDALLNELQSGRLRAALDVTDPEPLPAEHPLWSAPGVLVTPHVGGDSSAFAPRAYRLIYDQIVRFAGGRRLCNIVADG